MRRRLLSLIIVSVCLVSAAKSGFSQDAEADTVSADTVRNKFLPTGIRVGYDLIGAGKSYFEDDYTGWEIQGDIDFNRYYLAVDYGGWGRNRGSDSANYSNTGRYWRVGIDVNFLTTDPDRNVFFLGGRYGRSVFSESMSVVRYDPIWGVLSDTFHHSDVNASWVELTSGLKVKIWKALWLGYTARFKFALSAKGSTDMLPYDVPGFGLTNKETTWGFNYYVLIKLPIRKAPLPPPEK